MPGPAVGPGRAGIGHQQGLNLDPVAGLFTMAVFAICSSTSFQNTLST